MIYYNFVSANIIFHPLTYVIFYQIGWRLTYVTLAGSMLVIGLLTAAVFKPRDTVDQSGQSHATKPYEALLPSKNLSIPQRTKVIMKLFWFLATALKTVGYSIPLLTLVAKHKSHLSIQTN